MSEMNHKQKPYEGASVPENYDRYLVPLIFDDYAADLAARVGVRAGGAVLETACGTGTVTRHLTTQRGWIHNHRYLSSATREPGTGSRTRCLGSGGWVASGQPGGRARHALARGGGRSRRRCDSGGIRSRSRSGPDAGLPDLSSPAARLEMVGVARRAQTRLVSPLDRA